MAPESKRTLLMGISSLLEVIEPFKMEAGVNGGMEERRSIAIMSALSVEMSGGLVGVAGVESKSASGKSHRS